MNSNAIPVLLNQITAYEQNYILVETLMEESKTRAEALESVEKLKEHLHEVWRRGGGGGGGGGGKNGARTIRRERAREKRGLHGRFTGNRGLPTVPS